MCKKALSSTGGISKSAINETISYSDKIGVKSYRVKMNLRGLRTEKLPQSVTEGLGYLLSAYKCAFVDRLGIPPIGKKTGKPDFSGVAESRVSPMDSAVLEGYDGKSWHSLASYAKPEEGSLESGFLFGSSAEQPNTASPEGTR